MRNTIIQPRNTIFIIICLLIIFTLIKIPVASASEFLLPPPRKYYPLTASYFQSFIASEVEFTNILIFFREGMGAGVSNVRNQRLSIRSNYEVYSPFDWTINSYDEIEYYIVDYVDNDIRHRYSTAFFPDAFEPLYDIINSNLDYYCDGSEYGDNEYIQCYAPHIVLGDGYRNYVLLAIFPPESYPSSRSAKAFIKGWYPGDDPPEELVPILNFFEEEIIPEVTQHQTFPPPPSNQDPICVLDCPTLVVAESLPVPVVFDASGSYDPDGDPITYHWDFNGDGIFDGVGDEYTGDPWNPTHEFNQYGIHEVSLKVMDNRDGECVETVVIEIIES